MNSKISRLTWHLGSVVKKNIQLVLPSLIGLFVTLHWRETKWNQLYRICQWKVAELALKFSQSVTNNTNITLSENRCLWLTSFNAITSASRIVKCVAVPKPKQFKDSFIYIVVWFDLACFYLTYSLTDRWGRTILTVCDRKVENTVWTNCLRTRITRFLR